jgi:GTP:adenosylcobinamide-phosphate guanylyltransferase
MPLVDAIVIAGGIPKPDEPLYPLTQGKSKALLEIAGQPMVQWVLDALSEAQTLRRVVVMGLTEGDAPLRCRKTISYLPNQDSMLANIEAGMRWVIGQDGSAQHALVVSSDIPTLTSAALDWIVEASLQTDHEAYYTVIPKAEMERRFPGSRRSYFYFKDGTFTGGDVNLLATRLLTRVPPQMRALIEARKNIFKQASIIGLDTLLLFAARRLSTEDVARICSRRLNVTARVLICPHAEAGMDVDKPAQYELVKRDLESRRTS